MIVHVSSKAGPVDSFTVRSILWLIRLGSLVLSASTGFAGFRLSVRLLLLGVPDLLAARVLVRFWMAPATSSASRLVCGSAPPPGVSS